MKIVFDTNIYFAAAIKNTFSAEIIDIISKNKIFTIITSEEILLELTSKLKNKLKLPQEEVNQLLNKIRTITEIVTITETVSVITRDPSDNKILECALSGKTDLIVTLDQDLIQLKSFRGIGIIHPKTLSWTFPEYFKNKG
ncbi:putative toxin-antitoxin system toxin component, PIN family [Candidatus Daviesbacteria bacterium]|nr:putative toxin-antitoxin system toxin component, PIN family [Candidatus Daviesbacteria bacterium]